jgi:protein-disulfide isomerase
MIVIRSAITTALTSVWLAALVACATLSLSGQAKAQNATAAYATEPVSLPDMAIGPRKAPVTIIEYSSMTCSHCAAFEQNVLPMLRSKYIDTDKVRFVFREFPIDAKAAGASMLARCIANDDAGKYFGAIDVLFKQQGQLVARTEETLKAVGAQAGMSDQAVESCLRDQALLDKLTVDRKIAYEIVKVDATPTFFINGERYSGALSFEQLDKAINALLTK